ncbi:MAG: alpha-glucosidase [Lentisphaerae bacterium RIFOXYA12_FULL_48_11]|nr:MAG: alpha-glucosidase [Lentisphaerae bacterium RIFOXYA12_FULL_48_11]
MKKVMVGVLSLMIICSVRAVEVKSPDGRIILNFSVKDFSGVKACPVYSVAYKGKAVIADSRLGLELGKVPLVEGMAIVRETPCNNDTTWKPVYGERSSYRDNYNQLAVELKETAVPNRLLNLTFRVYNEGAAFCYTIPKQGVMEKVDITREQSEFRFLADHAAWAVSSAQGIYTNTTISKIKPGCERPLPIQVADDVFIAIGEAKLVDAARMKFEVLRDVPNALVSKLDGNTEGSLPLTTPWRFVMVAGSAGQLLENNFIILNLNDPCAIVDTSWIKPGKVIREVTLTTAGGKACIDFAVARGLQYIEYDAGWYGHEYDKASDASAVNLDPKRSKGPLDLQEVIKYGNEKGIGVLLYVNHLAAEKQLDQILPLYRKWGIKGVKYGFVNVGPQQWTSWLHMAVRKAADNQLMVDAHDEYRTTGYTRTYPNFMTCEGIGGDEISPSNTQTLNILFSRMIAGCADNTICYYDKRVDKNSSHAYQLAKAVCIYSPWQFLYWYDRPKGAPKKVGGAGGTETDIGGEPELEFYDKVPVVWDDTKVIHGKIGEFAVMARRSGDDWYIGYMNSGADRKLDVPLEFLRKDRKYVAHIYSDDPAVQTRTHVRIDRFVVNAGNVLKLSATAQGGQAVRIVPASRQDAFPFYK